MQELMQSMQQAHDVPKDALETAQQPNWWPGRSGLNGFSGGNKLKDVNKSDNR
jgi:hypothetical protein